MKRLTLADLIGEVISIREAFGFAGAAERFRIRVICAKMWAGRL